MGAVRWETQAGPNGVNRLTRVPEVAPAPAPAVTQAQVDRELVSLQMDVEAAAATVRDVRSRIRELVADAKHRERIRARLSPTRARIDPPAASGLTPAHIVRARALLGVSQREVSSFLGLHRSIIAEAERGARYLPDRLGRWAAGVLRASGEWPEGQ